jgi:hypothetical protein
LPVAPAESNRAQVDFQAKIMRRENEGVSAPTPIFQKRKLFGLNQEQYGQTLSARVLLFYKDQRFAIELTLVIQANLRNCSGPQEWIIPLLADDTVHVAQL